MEKRILVKFPGKSLAPASGMGLEEAGVAWVADELAGLSAAGFSVVAVLGASNLWKGERGAAAGVGRVTADMMGMLATLINGMALRDALSERGLEPRLFTSLRCDQAAAPYVKGKVASAMSKGRLPILVGGTGNPFFTADAAAALRARELGCMGVLRASDADVVDRVAAVGGMGFAEAGAGGVMDMAALTFLGEAGMPLVLFGNHVTGACVEAAERLGGSSGGGMVLALGGAR